MPSSSSEIGAGFDRADGVTQFLGTPTPVGARVAKTSLGLLNPDGTAFFIEELDDSPRIQFAEQLTFSHSYKMDVLSAGAVGQVYHRGTVIQDSLGFLYQLLNVDFAYQKGDYYIVTIVSECISSFTPPDEFNVQPVEFNPSIFYNPMYSAVKDYDPGVGVAAWNGQKIISAIQQAAESNPILTRTENYGAINADNIPDANILTLAQDLVQVLSYGADTFFLYGWKVSWSQYFYLPPPLNPGGYIEDPVTQGGLPSYFWSSDGSQTPDSNILTQLAVQVNPTFYSGGFSWLRQADDVVKERTWFRVDHSWIGGPLGRWDPLLYPTKPTT